MVDSSPTINSLLSHVNNSQKELPPVEQWDPPYCGEMDLIIKANGEWWHEQSPIGRKKLYRLFSTILKKTGNDYFLVTPVEKVKIQVEWQPFVIVDYQIIEIDGHSCFEFIDNCENKVILCDQAQLDYSTFENQQLPIINIRQNLFASFSRSCYYRIIEQAEPVETKGQLQVQIISNNQSFVLGTMEAG
jgi:uncharacterized protein